MLKIRREPHLVGQLLFIGTAALLIIIFMSNYQANLAAQNINTGYEFLSDSSGFAISQTLIPYNESSTYFRAYLVGVLNTLLVTFITIILSTTMGLIIALARMSKKNWLLQKLGYWYVELFRNIPPLLHVLFWYRVFFLRILPDRDNPLVFWNSIFFSIRGITLPEVSWNKAGKLFFTLGLTLLIVAYVVIYIRKKKNIAQGIYKRYWPLQIFVAVLFIIFFFVIPPFDLITPELGRFGFIKGMVITPELIALVLALASYSSVYVSEAIRSSVEAVPKGQSEAARSLGLKRSLYMRLVIFPQALQTVIPPVISQYLNILKNSSLGVVIAYPDLVSIFSGTTLNQVGRSLEIIAMTMVTYLFISITISFLMNAYNNHLRSKGWA